MACIILQLPVMVETLAWWTLLFAIAVVDEVCHSIQGQNQTYNQCFHTANIRNIFEKLYCKHNINDGNHQIS